MLFQIWKFRRNQDRRNTHWTQFGVSRRLFWRVFTSWTRVRYYYNKVLEKCGGGKTVESSLIRVFDRDKYNKKNKINWQKYKKKGASLGSSSRLGVVAVAVAVELLQFHLTGRLQVHLCRRVHVWGLCDLFLDPVLRKMSPSDGGCFCVGFFVLGCWMWSRQAERVTCVRCGHGPLVPLLRLVSLWWLCVPSTSLEECMHVGCMCRRTYCYIWVCRGRNKVGFALPNSERWWDMQMYWFGCGYWENWWKLWK